MTPHEGNDALSDLPFRTTYRCVRMSCALTVCRLGPIDRCPRCRAVMAEVERPQRDLEEFVAAATAKIVAGFDALLRASADGRS